MNPSRSSLAMSTEIAHSSCISESLRQNWKKRAPIPINTSKTVRIVTLLEAIVHFIASTIEPKEKDL